MYTRPTPTGSHERRLPAGGGGIAVNRKPARPRPATTRNARIVRRFEWELLTLKVRCDQ
jgi:hypothetical protein